jgi:hypothetical protein
MPLSRINTRSLTDGTVAAVDIADSSVTAAKLANTAVTPGTYGGSEAVPVIIVDQQGRLTSASNVAVAGGQFIDSQSTKVIYYNGQNVSSNVTIAGDRNAFSAGPITIDAGQTVTVNVGGTYTII